MLFFSLAIFLKTGSVSVWISPITTGVFDLIIPAFSKAISAKLLPKNCVWSNPIFVITDSIGEIIFVESRRPPKPTSIIAKSTFCLAKCSNAIPTVISKKDNPCLSKKFRFLFTKLITQFLRIQEPLILILSLKSLRWGEVYNPTL